jgi:hypothetical protein
LSEFLTRLSGHEQFFGVILWLLSLWFWLWEPCQLLLLLLHFLLGGQYILHRLDVAGFVKEVFEFRLVDDGLDMANHVPEFGSS